MSVYEAFSNHISRPGEETWFDWIVGTVVVQYAQANGTVVGS